MEKVKNIVSKAKEAYIKMMNLDNSLKNEILKNIIEGLKTNKENLYTANRDDLNNAKILLEENKINDATFERLKLNGQKIRDLIKGIESLIAKEDPVNKILFEKELDEGLILKKVSTPIGLIGVIFEARPDCFIQIVSLIIKSGNCAILKGGSECAKTNEIFAKIVKEALINVDKELEYAINSLYSRDDIKNILSMDQYIDLIIPRGGNNLVKFIKENTKIPVLGHQAGICHIFLDENFSLNDAIKIVVDAKTQYPSACNAAETLLIHKNFCDTDTLLNKIQENNITIVDNPKDYSTEYGSKTLSIKIVDDVNQAIEHINKYGSGHTDSILSDNQENIDKFMNLVDSACVFSNCSTRFSDGFRFGFGAEVGISTNKTHARGPVGLDGLTIYKYKLYGSNDIVAPYVSGEKNFIHKIIK